MLGMEVGDAGLPAYEAALHTQPHAALSLVPGMEHPAPPPCYSGRWDPFLPRGPLSVLKQHQCLPRFSSHWHSSLHRPSGAPENMLDNAEEALGTTEALPALAVAPELEWKLAACHSEILCEG